MSLWGVKRYGKSEQVLIKITALIRVASSSFELTRTLGNQALTGVSIFSLRGNSCIPDDGAW